MYHPHTHLKPVDDQIGVGVFATQPIPAGTIVYVHDELEPAFPPGHSMLSHPLYGPIIDKHAYTVAGGTRIMSWDIGNYINHNCDPNTLSTGYGFEIAIRDISVGDEITDDYGMLNLAEPMSCLCGASKCRGQILPDDLLTIAEDWDPQVIAALRHINAVDQPLAELLDEATRHALQTYTRTGLDYRSVESLHQSKHIAPLS